MKLPEFLEAGSLGEIRIKGHRVYLLHIVDDYNDGFSVGRLADEFDTVSRDVIEKAVNFYLDNKAEVDEYARAVTKRWIGTTRQPPRSTWKR